MINKLFNPIVVCIFIFIAISCKKDNSSAPQEKYFPKVKAIIQINCSSCHYSTGTFTGRPVVFDTDEEIAGKYKLIKAAVADPVSPGPGGNTRMPQGGTLSQPDINTIVKWFERGGKTTD